MQFFEEGEQAFASSDFASAIDRYGKAAELWTDNARIPEREKLARNKLEAREKAALGAQQLVDGRPDLAVESYRLAWPLDPEDVTLLEASTACEKVFKSWELAKTARGAMEQQLWAQGAKNFEQAMMLNVSTYANPQHNLIPTSIVVLREAAFCCFCSRQMRRWRNRRKNATARRNRWSWWIRGIYRWA